MSERNQEVLRSIESAAVVPVVRASSAETAARICEAIVAGGINCLEVTLTIPDALPLIRNLRERFGETVLLGAGTVLDVAAAGKCLDAGAQFIITPYLNPEIIEFCQSAGAVVCAGALTPTEIFSAWRAGAHCVKVFPASAAGGANYLKAIRAPFPEIRLVPTGGVDLANVAEFFAAGAFAVGVGGELADEKILSSRGAAEITRLATRYRAAASDAKRKSSTK